MEIPFRGSSDWLDTVTVSRGRGLNDYDTTNEEWGLSLATSGDRHLATSGDFLMAWTHPAAYSAPRNPGGRLVIAGGTPERSNGRTPAPLDQRPAAVIALILLELHVYASKQLIRVHWPPSLPQATSVSQLPSLKN